MDALLHNKTQAKFVEILRPILGNLGADIEIVNFIMSEHLSTAFNIRIYPSFVYKVYYFLEHSLSLAMDFFIDGRWPSAIDPANNPGPSVNLLHTNSIEESHHISKRYFDSHTKSFKIKSMHDRRTFFMRAHMTEEDLHFLRTDGETEQHGVRPNERTVRTDDIDVERGVAVNAREMKVLSFQQLVL